MRHSEFQIGLVFWCGGRRWQCTDIGTRVVIAISLEPHTVEELTTPNDGVGPSQLRRYTTDDPSWLVGPPYAIAESIFDEYDIEGCTTAPEDNRSDHRAVG